MRTLVETMRLHWDRNGTGFLRPIRISRNEFENGEMNSDNQEMRLDTEKRSWKTGKWNWDVVECDIGCRK